MGSAFGLRDDFDGAALRRMARGSKSANLTRRLLAGAEIYDGGSPTSAARIDGVGLQIVRDWVSGSMRAAQLACSTARHRDNGLGMMR
jgi:hypothetical protein